MKLNATLVDYDFVIDQWGTGMIKTSPQNNLKSILRQTVDVVIELFQVNGGFELVCWKDASLRMIGKDRSGVSLSDRHFFEGIARYVKSGSWMEFVELDNPAHCHPVWRWTFDGLMMKTVYPKMIWE